MDSKADNRTTHVDDPGIKAILVGAAREIAQSY